MIQQYDANQWLIRAGQGDFEKLLADVTEENMTWRSI
jgi:hypothetical protein